jgi:hypothetical protein
VRNNAYYAKRMSRLVFMMTRSIRYYRPGRSGDAGLLIAKKSEFLAYKARLEAAGYVVLEDSELMPPPIPPGIPH